MALDPSGTLMDRFHAARTVLDVVVPRRRRVGRSYQGFIKAMLRTAAIVVPQVQDHLRGCVRTIAGSHWTRFGWVIFAVDGTKVDCVRSRANERFFATASKPKSHPQQLLTTLWHMGTGLPWAWVIGRANADERKHLRQMLHLLPQSALLVADAGYTGYDLLQEVQNDGTFFLIRAGANVKLLRELGFSPSEDGATVYLWPLRCRTSPPLVLRLIKVRVPRRRKPVYLITNVLDRDRLDDDTAAAIYQLRWGVEVFYRSLKQTLQRRKMRSAAPRQAVLELQWTLIGLLLMGLLTVSGIIRRGKDPLSWSVACSLRIIRQALGTPAISLRTLQARLARAVKDAYTRRRTKTARNWPHKKNDPPIGPPRIRRARQSEVQQLARINPMLTAQ